VIEHGTLGGGVESNPWRKGFSSLGRACALMGGTEQGAARCDHARGWLKPSVDISLLSLRLFFLFRTCQFIYRILEKPSAKALFYHGNPYDVEADLFPIFQDLELLKEMIKTVMNDST
jgi:hypothetical protein